jgi:hypothetical protein
MAGKHVYKKRAQGGYGSSSRRKVYDRRRQAGYGVGGRKKKGRGKHNMTRYLVKKGLRGVRHVKKMLGI